MMKLLYRLATRHGPGARTRRARSDCAKFAALPPRSAVRLYLTAHSSALRGYASAYPAEASRALAIALCFFGLTIYPLPFRRAVAQNPSVPTLVCVISGSDGPEGQPQNNMDAVVLIDNGKLKQPYPEYNEKAQATFAKEYFRSGTKYRVTFGGGEVGTATIKGSDTGCNNIHATAAVEYKNRIPAHLSVLATNSISLGTKPSLRRAPSDAERQAVMKLVNQIYRSHATMPASLRTLTTTNLTATALDADGKFELVGSFVIEAKTVKRPRTPPGVAARRDLFLIAEPVTETPGQSGSVRALSYKAVLINFQSYKLPPEGFDSAVDFVDQLDLDGDGTAEVFVTQHGFDAYGYSIYRKTSGRWRKVYTTTGDAC